MVPEEVVAIVLVAVDGVSSWEEEEEEEEEGEEEAICSHGGGSELQTMRTQKASLQF